MRVAVTGVRGFIGSYAAARLAERGHAVTGLVRGQSRREHVEPYVDRFVVGDQADETVWPKLLEDADCLVHSSFDWTPLRGAGDLESHLRSNVAASIRLIERAAPRRVIYISSVAVHHEISDHWRGVIDSLHPLRPGSLYGACKAAIEAHLWAARAQHQMPFAILRPCAVYGIDPNLERSIGYPFIEQIRRRERFRRAGGGKFVHVEDVAQTIVASAEREEKDDALVVNLADCYARWADIAIMIAELLGLEGEIEIDTSSPPRSKNIFSKDEAEAIGVRLDRGHEGLRSYLSQLVDRVTSTAGSSR